MIIGFANYLLATIITYLLKKPTIGWGDTSNQVSRYLYMIIMKAY